MVLSPIGIIVLQEWKKTIQMRQNMVSDTWVIMPNHIHMVIHIQNDTTVETHCNASLHQHTKSWQPNQFGPQHNNIPSIIRGFKSSVTRRTDDKWGTGYFVWQPRYHDRIIRDEFELNRIRKYIRENPEKWEQDELYQL